MQEGKIGMTVTWRLILNHVVKGIIQEDLKDPFNQCIVENWFDSVSDLLLLLDAAIAALTYTNNSTEESLQGFCRNKIRILKAWNQYLLARHCIEHVNWMDDSLISLEALNTFTVSAYDPEKLYRSTTFWWNKYTCLLCCRWISLPG